MSSLTKKLLLFLVFSIPSDYTTSNDTRIKSCNDNISDIFHSRRLHKSFKFAMAALSEKSMNLIATKAEAGTLVYYFKSYDTLIKNIDDKNFILKHKEVIEYSEVLNILKKHKDVCLAENVSSLAEYESSLDEKQNDLLGYFQSFVAQMGNIDAYFMARKVELITMSPQEFCVYLTKSVLDKTIQFVCIKALSIMLKLQDSSPIMDRFINMTASEAFKYCYLNYTYLDFTTENFFPESGSSSSSSSSSNVESSIKPNESTKKLLIGIMIKYFSHLLHVSTQLADFHKRLGKGPWIHTHTEPPESPQAFMGPSIFTTVDAYCLTTAG